MQIRSIAVVLGGLMLMPVAGTMAQAPDRSVEQADLASAPNPRGEYIVFLDSGSRLSPTAIDTVREAAQAAKAAHAIRLEGRADYAEAVKKELVREGVPAGAITVARDTDKPLQKVGAGDPLDRRVEIRF